MANGAIFLLIIILLLSLGVFIYRKGDKFGNAFFLYILFLFIIAIPVIILYFMALLWRIIRS